VLIDLNKPLVEFNVLEAYISRLRGEFSKQQPSVKAKAYEDDPQNPGLPDFIAGYVRSKIEEANNEENMEYECYTDLLSGGFSVAKVWTEYQGEQTFNQSIKLGRVFDPTLCGFDPMARKPHKGDGNFCFELFPITKERAEKEFGIKTDKISFTRNFEGFSWFYNNGQQDILLICYYYEKEKHTYKIHQLANGQTITDDEYKSMLEQWDSIAMPPAIVHTRETYSNEVVRYTMYGDEVIERKRTMFDELPLVFGAGSIIRLRQNSDGGAYELTRPYIYQAMGAQKLKNFAGQSLANELENTIQHKFKVSKDTIPPEYVDAYTDIQKASVLVWDEFKDGNPDVRLTPPAEIARPPIPAEFAGTFGMTDGLIQSILGSYDASLGINNNQLSGVAIVEGATQSNATAMPFIVGILQMYTRMAEIVTSLIPKIHQTPVSVPIINADGSHAYQMLNQQEGVNTQYKKGAIKINISAGANFSIQKSRTLQQLETISKMSPQIAQFLAEEGVPYILDNVEMRNIDLLKERFEQWQQKQQQLMQQQQQMQQQMQQQAMQNNPMALKREELMMKAQIEQEKLAEQAHQDSIKNNMDVAKIQIEQEKAEMDRTKMFLEMQEAEMQGKVQLTKAATEQFAKEAEMEMKQEEHRMQQARAAVDLQKAHIDKEK
jgi:hypothetical protein